MRLGLLLLLLIILALIPLYESLVLLFGCLHPVERMATICRRTFEGLVGVQIVEGLHVKRGRIVLVDFWEQSRVFGSVKILLYNCRPFYIKLTHFKLLPLVLFAARWLNFSLFGSIVT